MPPSLPFKKTQTFLLMSMLAFTWQERKVAAEALASVEAALQAARPGLKERLGSVAAALPEHHQLDAFYQTVSAAGTQQWGLGDSASSFQWSLRSR